MFTGDQGGSTYTLTALPWGMQKAEREVYRWARGAGGATTGKPPLLPPTRRVRGSTMGQGRGKEKTEAGKEIWDQSPW